MAEDHSVWVSYQGKWFDGTYSTEGGEIAVTSPYGSGRRTLGKRGPEAEAQDLYKFNIEAWVRELCAAGG
jgi:hypothetical protein